MSEPNIPEELKPYISGLRDEAAAWRVKYRESEATLATAGPVALEAANAKIRELTVGTALTEAALKLGANPRLARATLLMDGVLATLDPAKADFMPALESAIKTAMQADPGIKGAATFMPVRSGSDITNNGTATPIGNGTVTRDMVQAARSAGDHEQVAKWQRTGQLDAMLRGEV